MQMTPRFMSIYRRRIHLLPLTVERCLDNVKEWMATSKLKLNSDKTEFIVFGSKRQRDKLKAFSQLPSWVIPSALLSQTQNWEYGLNLVFHCTNMFRMSTKVVSCNSVTLDMSGSFLTHDASVLVASALVSSWLDYCNSLFRSLSKFNLGKSQCIQNSAARIASNTSRYASITPVLKKLYWLPVELRSVVKTDTLYLQVSLYWFSQVFYSIYLFL